MKLRSATAALLAAIFEVSSGQPAPGYPQCDSVTGICCSGHTVDNTTIPALYTLMVQECPDVEGEGAHHILMTVDSGGVNGYVCNYDGSVPCDSTICDTWETEVNQVYSYCQPHGGGGWFGDRFNWDGGNLVMGIDPTGISNC